MRLNLHALPGSLFARMALLLLAGLVAAQFVSFWLFSGERSTVVAQTRNQQFVERLADLVQRLENETPLQRAATLAGMQRGDLRAQWIAAESIAPNPPRGQLQANLAARLGGPREMRIVSGAGGGGMNAGMGSGPGGGMGWRARNEAPFDSQPSPRPALQRSLDIRLQDGQWLRVTLQRDSDPPALPRDFYLHLLLAVGIVAAAIIFAVRQATRPLHTLAQAAENFGRDLDAPPLPEQGANETRRAAQAFNRMQARIKRLVEERARALAAVSHDLRTPLTRLRLRTELVDNEELREQMAADLDAMAAMLDASLDYLRGLQDSEPARPIDINALLQTLVDDNAIQGRSLVLLGAAKAPYRGRLAALQRALQNLIDNAFKYGHDVRLNVTDKDDALLLAVEDNGPGVPPAELERLGTPYYRPDAARRSATGGVGLGLSIARDVAAMHGGTLTLANRPSGGFTATLCLPRVAVATTRR